MEFKVKILGSCPGDALLRQCMEAVSIRQECPSLNGRAEWGAGNGKQKRKKTTNENNDVDDQNNSNNNDNNDDADSTNIINKKKRGRRKKDNTPCITETDDDNNNKSIGRGRRATNSSVTSDPNI